MSWVAASCSSFERGNCQIWLGCTSGGVGLEDENGLGVVLATRRPYFFIRHGYGTAFEFPGRIPAFHLLHIHIITTCPPIRSLFFPHIRMRVFYFYFFWTLEFCALCRTGLSDSTAHLRVRTRTRENHFFVASQLVRHPQACDDRLGICTASAGSMGQPIRVSA
jgi:hypothetical protein